ATQFFANMVVVDNTGDNKTIPPQILEWARPTVEMTDIKGRILILNPRKREFSLKEEDTKEKKGKVYHFVLAPEAVVHLTSEENTFDDLQAGQEIYVAYRLGDARPAANGVIL